MSIVDIVPSLFGDFLFVKLNLYSCYKAMSIHQSQFVFYRKLFILFSRYSLINTYDGFKYIDV